MIERTHRAASPIIFLAALMLGLAAGALLPSVSLSVSSARTLGLLWLSALQMTVVPMIFLLVVTGVGATLSAAAASGMAVRTLGLFAVMLLAAAFFGVALMDVILGIFPIPGTARDTAIQGAGAPALVLPAGEWLRGFIPANPVAAAANGAIAPLVVFSLAFGFAATQIAPDARRALLSALDGALQAMLVIVAWVLRAAPIGIACLAYVAVAQSGLSTAGALLHYVLTSSLFCSILVVVLYPVVLFAGGIAPGRFARAAAPAQMLAFCTQSSVGTLPAMIEATARLGGVASTRQVVLPLAVSLFRLGSAASGGAIALYVARLSGGSLGWTQMAAAAGLSAVVSIAAVGLPSQASYVTMLAPICLGVGVPLDALVLLMAVDSIPDAFRTVANVTGDIVVTAISSGAGRSVAELPKQGGGGSQIDTVEPFPETADR